MNIEHRILNLEVKSSKKIEENLFNFINFSFYISIPHVRDSRFEIFLFEPLQKEYLAKKSNNIMNKTLHQFENLPMCKFEN